MPDLRSLLAEFGANRSAVHLLDDDDPELLPYATLTAARRRAATLRAVEAVYEWQGAPLAFIVHRDSVEDDEQLRRIRRLLAMRGDAPYVALVAPGRIEVYGVALDNEPVERARVDLDDAIVARRAVFPRLGSERPVVPNQNWISNVVLGLLTDSTDRLRGLRLAHGEAVSQADAFSLVGRALFTRFLADRGLLPDHMSDPDTTARLFDARDEAERTSKWLDRVFNGDLLPLSDDRVFEMLPDDGYLVLGNVLRKAPDDQLFFNWQQKWAHLDFAHIPVGVLSQAYELTLRRHAPKKQRRQGGYYTPTPIAELMVRASFRALQRRDMGKSARVLDPAVGAGVFLLTAFRELVAEHWRADKKRPDTRDLRRILSNQLVGFDIDESALRYAALGLYLLSIELDPDPKPVELRFDVLRDKVLYRLAETDNGEAKELGSLGPLVGEEHRGRYDLVTGNPPWVSRKQLPNWELVAETVNRIAAARGISDASPPLPNQGRDLPFVWRAMEWAKPDGQIALALHARLLFQQGSRMPEARQALFEAIDVTSIINGAELRQTAVWPHIKAPFCILFATNRKPGVGAGFRFITPRLETALNRSGTMRIDAGNADIVSSRRLAETPQILKVLFRGTNADLGLVERIRAQGHPTLAEFWRERVGAGPGQQLRGVGRGYQTLKPSSHIRKRGDGLPGFDASHLHGLPEITVQSLGNILVDPQRLPIFSHERLHRARSPELYRGPLVVVHQSLPAATRRIRVAVSDKDAVFNESLYGYSPGGHPDAGLLARYLALVFGSKVAVWLALVTSGKFGLERDVVEMLTLNRIKIPDFDELTEGRRGEIERLVDGLDSGDASWSDVDEWVMGLYGLGARDRQVVFDTLEFGLPFAENRQRAQEVPGSDERERFCEVLRKELSPWCERFDSALAVEQIPSLRMSPWQAIEVRNAIREPGPTVLPSDWEGLLEFADETAASEILQDGGPNRLLVGRLAQRRHWSATQARLLAQRIIWSHIDLLKGGTDA